MSPSGLTTYGWDVVYATRTAAVNDGLADASETFEETVTEAGNVVQVKGSLGGWQIAPGGSGSLLNFAVPSATLGLSGGKKKFAYTGGRFLVQATLTVQASGSSGRHDLVVTPGRGAVTVLDASFPETGFNDVAVYARSALQAWLDVQQQFPYVLASIELAGPGLDGPDATLAPTSVSYAYTDTATSGGVLGLLCTVHGGADAAGLLQEVSPDAVADSDAAVLLGEGLLRRLLGGAGTAVTLPSSTGSTVQISAPSAFPVQIGRTSA